MTRKNDLYKDAGLARRNAVLSVRFISIGTGYVIIGDFVLLPADAISRRIAGPEGL